MNFRSSLLLVWFMHLLCGNVLAQKHEGVTLVEAGLVADVSAVAPGKPFTVALNLKMAPHWHTYWAFGGDAGMATRIEWKLPEGFTAGPIQWPVPKKLMAAGDVLSFGYEDQVALLVEITPPAALPAGGSVQLLGDADWLVCEEICLPGGAEVSLTLQVADAPIPANEEFFQKWRAKIPKQRPGFPEASWSKVGKTLRLTFKTPAEVTDFFPLPGPDDVIGHVKKVAASPPTFEVPFEAPETLAAIPGVALIGEEGWQVEARVAPATSSVEVPPPTAPPAEGLAWSLVLGFIGGLILNVMPCVFPVISLKIYGFVQQSANDRKQILRLGIAFIAGIYAWFLGFAIFAILVKMAGGTVNYAQQFQDPYFVLGISAFVLLFALNFLGVYEVMLPQKAENAAAKAASHTGLAGAFGQGLFATILGTSCTAPVLGAALTFAMAQPPIGTLLMFTSIATGMSFPYLLLAAFPGWMRFLPRPGGWMTLFKQGVGFALLAVLLWLLYVLAYQKGIEGALWAAIFLFAVTLACWLYGQFQGPGHTARSRTVAFSFMVLFPLVAGVYGIGKEFAACQPPSQESLLSKSPDGIAWEAFTPARYEEALQSDRMVYIDFTAKWCMTCLSNKRTVLETSAIRKLFRDENILAIQADYTNQNPEIAKLLQHFGRSGVPLNVILPAGDRSQPILLPELLTQGVVMSAIEQARAISTAGSGKSPAAAPPK